MARLIREPNPAAQPVPLDTVPRQLEPARPVQNRELLTLSPSFAQGLRRGAPVADTDRAARLAGHERFASDGENRRAQLLVGAARGRELDSGTVRVGDTVTPHHGRHPPYVH
ncbi:hypothetical protein ACFRU3_24940 [Streptomyces sp. NPDC056910]|uniref:hypothetical protein n=1 Tax=Streptomyces sp. NPDC056910 TaxID=3345964 RepID=UPI0036C9F679